MRHPHGLLSRRAMLLTGAAALLTGSAQAETVRGSLPWAPNAGSPPTTVRPGPWVFFTPEEGSLMEAIADRLIPPDPQWAGGKDAGCAVFIDRQLGGPYGTSQGLYMLPPFLEATPEQGMQSPQTPAEQMRTGLAALDHAVRAAYAGKPLHDIPPDEQDKFLQRLQSGDAKLEGADGRKLMMLLIDLTKQGFLTDPVYGGNRDMVGWRMIGFPGARYDYRDWVGRHNERYPRPPVPIAGGHA
jgi:gluconate 2-dehydrogenase gamma chain